MPHTLADIAKAIGGQAVGDVSIVVTSTAEPAVARPDQLALVSNPAYAQDLSKGAAKAALLWADADWAAMGLLGAVLAPRPKFAMAGVTALFDPSWRVGEGVHASAVIDPSAEIGDDVAIGPFCVIGAGAKIAAGARIASHCSIGKRVQIGPQATIGEGVRILHDVTIGARFVAQPNAVIGADGFSFVTPEPSSAETARASLGEDIQGADQAWARVHSLGGVEIGDDVEVGAGTCIDRGTIRATRIASGTKIDNLVQIGHNVVVGENGLICGKAGIAGSAVLGRNVVLAGEACVADNITVGDGAVAAYCAKIVSNVPAGRMMMGYPAVQMKTHLDIYKASRRLPRLIADVASLKKAVSKPDQSD